MEKSNEEKDLYAFSWPSFLMVTGVSLFLFALVLKFIDGEHISLFLYAGAGSLVAGFLGWLIFSRR